MTIDTIMNPDVVTVDMDMRLSGIRDLLERKGFHHLLVVEGKELLGVISDRDVLRAISPFADTESERERDHHTLERRAHQIMSRDLCTAHRETGIEEAVQLLLRNEISCLPIVSHEGFVEGIVTRQDLLRYYSDQV